MDKEPFSLIQDGGTGKKQSSRLAAHISGGGNCRQGQLTLTWGCHCPAVLLPVHWAHGNGE